MKLKMFAVYMAIVVGTALLPVSTTLTSHASALTNCAVGSYTIPYTGPGDYTLAINNALYAYTNVILQGHSPAYSYTISDQIISACPNATLTGGGVGQTTIQLAHRTSNWLSSTLYIQGGSLTVSNLTMDGNLSGVTGIGYSNVTLSSMRITNYRCIGVHVLSAGVVINNNSQIDNTGFSCDPYDNHPGAAIYADGQQNHAAAPDIENSFLINNQGEGIDISEMDNGKLLGNHINNNAREAAVGIYESSGWTITGNIISHPPSTYVNGAHPDCGHGPGDPGGHSAAIWLCQDSLASRVTQYNTITYNNFSGYYGILSIGTSDTPSSNPVIPHDNIIQHNELYGSTQGCAEDYPLYPQPHANDWEYNDCAGPSHPNSLPTVW